MPPLRVTIEAPAGAAVESLRPPSTKVPALTMIPPPKVSPPATMDCVAARDSVMVLSSTIAEMTVPPAIPFP